MLNRNVFHIYLALSSLSFSTENYPLCWQGSSVSAFEYQKKELEMDDDIPLITFSSTESSLTDSSSSSSIDDSTNYGALTTEKLIENSYLNADARKILCERLWHNFTRSAYLTNLDSLKLFPLNAHSNLSKLSCAEIFVILFLGKHKEYEIDLVPAIDRKKDLEPLPYLILMGWIHHWKLHKEKEGISYFQKAADQGSPMAQNILGWIYQHGKGIKKDYQRAFAYYHLAANQNYAPAQCELGHMYYHGYGILKNRKEALKYYTLAADQNNEIGQYNLGHMYYYGKGVEKNIETAFSYFKLAADQGNPLSQFNLALLYQQGEGISQSKKMAFKYYTLAADQNNPRAQYNVGLMYQESNAITDHIAGFEYQKKAADQGLAPAQYSVGRLYQKGAGTLKSMKNALIYFNLAADQGHIPSLNTLGLMYKRGRGVEKDPKKSLTYFQLAANLGNTKAKQNIIQLYRMDKNLLWKEMEKDPYISLDGVDYQEQLKIKFYRAQKGDEEEQAYFKRKISERYKHGYIPYATQIQTGKIALQTYLSKIQKLNEHIETIHEEIYALNFSENFNIQKEVFDREEDPRLDNRLLKFDLDLINQLTKIQGFLITDYENECDNMLELPGFYISCFNPSFTSFAMIMNEYTVNMNLFYKKKFISLTPYLPRSLTLQQQSSGSPLLTHSQKLMATTKNYTILTKRSLTEDTQRQEIFNKIISLDKEVQEIYQLFNPTLLEAEEYLNFLFLESIDFYCSQK